MYCFQYWTEGILKSIESKDFHKKCLRSVPTGMFTVLLSHLTFQESVVNNYLGQTFLRNSNSLITFSVTSIKLSISLGQFWQIVFLWEFVAIETTYNIIYTNLRISPQLILFCFVNSFF